MPLTNIIPIYELGPDFYDEVIPAIFPNAILRFRNQEAARIINLDQLTPDQWKHHFWSFKPIPANMPTPLALRYHGHQFQSYNPELGDGRGFLYAQFLYQGQLFDLGTKGSGQTPYSRGGDGRLTLKGAFREILATELLQSYGVNTSKTLSVFETGESLVRHDEPSPTRAGVLVRLSKGHIRIGTFQRLAFLRQADNIKKLLNYCVKYYYPSLVPMTDENEKAALFLKAVTHACAETVSSWMIAGFVHGVLNTDNINITGESFDYGPYRFLPTYDPDFVAAYFDQTGLYSFGRQPISILWNLHQLGISLKSAFPNLEVEKCLEGFSDVFNISLRRQLLNKLNLLNPLKDQTGAEELEDSLIAQIFQFMQQENTLFEQTFFDLHSGVNPERLSRSPQKEIYQKESFNMLKDVLECFEVKSEERSKHPYFSGTNACSLIIDELEALWKPIAENDDWAPFDQKLKDIRSFRGVYD